MTQPTSQRLARLLSLVPWLSQHQGVTIAEAAEHFGISAEQLERDLWLVVCCGLPGHGPDQLIDIQFWDDEGHIDVIDPQTLVAPTRLTIEEAASLQVGLTMLSTLASEEDRHLISATLSAISAATGLPSTIEQDHAGTSSDEPLSAVVTADQSILDVISEAAAERGPVIIDYYGATRDVVSRRLIWPSRIVMSATFAYVEAWCSTARGHRTFRLDRIQSATQPEDRPFDGPPDLQRPGDARADAASHPDGGAAVAPTRVGVRIHRDSRWILDSFDFDLLGPDAPGSDPRRGDDAHDDDSHGDETATEWIPATIRVWDEHWFTGLVCSLGGHLVVVSPLPLRRAVREAAQRGLAGIERGPVRS